MRCWCDLWGRRMLVSAPCPAGSRRQPLTHLQDGSAGWLRYRYRHIVVDEAQDLRPGHRKLLRAMVARDRNDVFLVGDTHQRIYNNQVTLGSLGINIRGRSAKLTLSYRTTRQILGSALGVLSGETFDDLNGGEDTLAGYRSVLSGARPELHPCADWESERQATAELVAEWSDIHLEQIAICVPTNAMAQENRCHPGPAGYQSHGDRPRRTSRR